MGEYLYEHFYGDLLREDQRFRTGPAPGMRMPEVELETLGGERIHIGGRRDRPMLLTFGSVTCPMTAASVPILKRMHARYGDAVDFVTLYVRESHPGDRIPQPRTLEEKRAHAALFRDEHEIPWPIAVDDIEGSLHQQLDPKPAAAYLVDHNGIVVFRSLWSTDPGALRFGLNRFLAEGGVVGELQHIFEPFLRGLWHYDAILRTAGPEALQDLRREAPLLYYAARALGVVRHPAFPVVAAMTVGAAVALLRRRAAGAAAR